MVSVKIDTIPGTFKISCQVSFIENLLAVQTPGILKIPWGYLLIIVQFDLAIDGIMMEG